MLNPPLTKNPQEFQCFNFSFVCFAAFTCFDWKFHALNFDKNKFLIVEPLTDCRALIHVVCFADLAFKMFVIEGRMQPAMSTIFYKQEHRKLIENILVNRSNCANSWRLKLIKLCFWPTKDWYFSIWALRYGLLRSIFAIEMTAQTKMFDEIFIIRWIWGIAQIVGG